MENGEQNIFRENLSVRSCNLLANSLKNDNKFRALEELKSSSKKVWHEILFLAFRHKILWHLKDLLPGEIIPTEIKQSLTEACRNETLKNLMFVAEMVAIQNAAKDNNLDFMFYKGAVLAAHLYQHVGARKFEDLDLICPSIEVAKEFRDCLIKMGYFCIDELNAVQEKQYCKYHCEFMLFHPKKKILVEIHWRFFPGYFAVEPDLKDLFARPQMVEVAGNNFQTLSNEDMVVAIAAHSTKHLWNDWRQIIDFARLIQKQSIDWDLVKQIAEKTNSLRMVKSGIHLVRIAGLLPSDFCIFKEFEADRVGQNAAKSILKRHMTNQPSAHNIYEEMVYLLKMQSNWANRLKFAFGAILSPSKNDFAFVSFSEKNSWLYYFVRPFRQILRVFKGR